MNPRLKKRLILTSIATVLCLGAQGLVPALALARTEGLRWSHPNPAEVVRFELLIGTASQSYSEIRDLGRPTPDAQGVYSSSFDVADETTVYIAIRAVGTDLTSVPSNEKVRAGLPPTEGGGTVSPPPADTSSTSIEDPGVSAAPHPDAFLYVDFSAGANDWLDTQPNHYLAEDDSLFFVTDVAGNPTLTTQSQATDILSHYAGTPSDFSNYRFSGRMALDQSNGGIGVTFFSLFPQYTRYYGLKRDPGGAFGLSAYPYGGLSCGTQSTSVVPQPGKWYQFEVSVKDEGTQNRIEASVWERGTSKPSTPQVVCTDTTYGRPTGGKIGVWSAGAGQKYWDDFELVQLDVLGGGVSIPLDPPVLIDVRAIEP